MRKQPNGTPDKKPSARPGSRWPQRGGGVAGASAGANGRERPWEKWALFAKQLQCQAAVCLLTLFSICSYPPFGMVLLLRKSSAQARIEGWDPRNRSDHDYAVVEDTIVGRIYREMIIAKPKWRWFLQQIPEAGPGRPIPPPNQGMADTLEDAQAAFKKRYEEVKWRK